MVTQVGKANLRDIGSGRPPRKPPAVTITQLEAPVGGTGADVGAYDTAANRDLAIVSLNAARDDLAALRTVLVNLGLVSE